MFVLDRVRVLCAMHSLAKAMDLLHTPPERRSSIHVQVTNTGERVGKDPFAKTGARVGLGRLKRRECEKADLPMMKQTGRNGSGSKHYLSGDGTGRPESFASTTVRVV
jgi:hypothetical protein